MFDIISVPSFPPYQPIKNQNDLEQRPNFVVPLAVLLFKHSATIPSNVHQRHFNSDCGLLIHAAFGCFSRLPASPAPPTRLVPINSELRWWLAGASSGFAKWRGCMVHVSGGSIWRARCFRTEREYMTRANQMIFTPHLFVTFRRNGLVDLLHALTSL